MAYIIRDLICEVCNHKYEDLIDSKDDLSGLFSCPACGVDGGRVQMSAPHLRTPNNSASVVDGTKKKGMAELKEHHSLLSEAYSASGETRKALEREAHKIIQIK